MAEELKKWTHTNRRISDIRKLSEFYIFTINDDESVDGSYDPAIEHILMVKDKIFEDRLKSYFLKEPYKVTREEILSVKWNMYITKDHYIKIDDKGGFIAYPMDPDKYYVSFLEINGPLGGFSNICKAKCKINFNNH